MSAPILDFPYGGEIRRSFMEYLVAERAAREAAELEIAIKAQAAIYAERRARMCADAELRDGLKHEGQGRRASIDNVIDLMDSEARHTTKCLVAIDGLETKIALIESVLTTSPIASLRSRRGSDDGYECPLEDGPPAPSTNEEARGLR
jgi:hypothetical protein